jgi:hypothetical protein
MVVLPIRSAPNLGHLRLAGVELVALGFGTGGSQRRRSGCRTN